MNRSILIVIADFLLVSLLAFSSFDPEKLTSNQPAQKSQLTLQPAANGVSANQDLMNALQLALADEQRLRQQMVGELNQSRQNVRGQQSALAEREKQFDAMQRDLQTKEQQARQLEQARNALQRQFDTAQANLQALQEQSKANANQAATEKQRLAATEAALRNQQAQVTQAQQRLADLEKNRQSLESEKQLLAQQLQVSEAEKRLAAQQLTSLQNEVRTAQKEKAQLIQHADKLAEGVSSLAQSSDKLAERVTALASNSGELKEKVTELASNSGELKDKVTTLAKTSGELTKEVREYRPMAANAIFNDFAANRVHARFNATRTGILGIERNKRRQTETILVTDGTNTFALCHVDDTPFSLWTPGTDWEWLTGTLGRGLAEFPINVISFYLLDPRAVLIPVTNDQARQLGCRVYHLAPDPFRFQDAILVGAREGYYGQCKFQIDLTTPQYVKMDRSLFRGLFGKFNPSRGDLVFSMTGELLGIMANSTYCIVIHNFKSAANFQFGEGVRAENTGEVLSRLGQRINQLPLKLR